MTIQSAFSKLTAHCWILYNQGTSTYKEEKGWHNWAVNSRFGWSLNHHWHSIDWPWNYCLFSSIFISSKCNHRECLWIGKWDFHIKFCFDWDGQHAECCSHAGPNRVPQSQRSYLWHHENYEGLQCSGIVLSVEFIDKSINFIHY